MFYFHKVVYVQYLGEVGIFHTWVKKFIPLYNSAKIIKIDRDFPKLWSQMYCHLFYGSQCILCPDKSSLVEKFFKFEQKLAYYAKKIITVAASD